MKIIMRRLCLVGKDRERERKGRKWEREKHAQKEQTP